VSIVPGIRQFCTSRFFANRHHRLLNMDTLQISCTLNNVKSFLGAFPSDMLPHSITQPDTIIVNTDAHTQSGTHWLAIRLEPRSSNAFYFDSYGLSPYVPDIQSFLRRNCTVLNYNNTQLQGPISIICGEHCCLFAQYMDKVYTDKQFIGLYFSKPNLPTGRKPLRNRIRVSMRGTSRRTVLHP
jgi:hypothetical protein